MQKKRYLEAFHSFSRLRQNDVQAARDLYYAHSLLRQEELLIEEAGIAKNANFFTPFAELFTIPRIRRATQSSGIVMIAQQMCGSECPKACAEPADMTVNVIAFYSSTIFTKAGATVTQALMASWGFGLVNFVFALPAVFTIDTFGRRTVGDLAGAEVANENSCYCSHFPTCAGPCWPPGLLSGFLKRHQDIWG